MLENFLSKKGYDVQFLVHNVENFYNVPKTKILRVERNNRTKISLLYSYIKTINTVKPDVVIAYGLNSAFLCEISRIFVNFNLIVSERNLRSNFRSFSLIIRRILHYVLADFFFVNSLSQQKDIRKKFPFLNTKLIRNTFVPDYSRAEKRENRTSNNEIRILGVGKYLPQKNIIFLLKVVARIKTDHPKFKLTLKWYGDMDGVDKIKYLAKCKKFSRILNIVNEVTFNPPTRYIYIEYERANVFVLPSLNEGTPNVALEAMHSGLPLCLSDVSDHKYLIRNGVNGFLISNFSVEKWAKLILEASQWDKKKRKFCFSASDYILNKYYGLGNLKQVEKLFKKKC